MIKLYQAFRDEWWMPPVLAVVMGLAVTVAGIYAGVWFACMEATAFTVATAIVAFVFAFAGFIAAFAGAVVLIAEL